MLYRDLFTSIRAAALGMLVVSAIVTGAQAQVNVLTHHYDNARTGLNAHETILNTSNVNANQFGKLFALPVDGQVYAQPLYVANLVIPGKGTHNVLFVATMHDSVYAFDADSVQGVNAAPLWKISLLNPALGVTTIPLRGNIGPEQGILSTPVIDLSTNTIYLVAATLETVNGTSFFPMRLHALDITTGTEKFGGPVTLDGSVPGTGTASVNGIITFNPAIQNQRSALLLSNGVIYIANSSHGDLNAYHGWIHAYDAHTLSRLAIFNDTPNGSEGGIWMSGAGPAADADGNIYLATGNGTFYRPAPPASPTDYGEAILKLGLSNGAFSILDYFVPFNFYNLNTYDHDLGSGGVMLLPETNAIIGGGKEAQVYLLNTANMGHWNPHGNDSQIVQSFPATTAPYPHHIQGQPVYWNGPNGPAIFVWCQNDEVHGYSFVNGLFQTTPFAQSALGVPSQEPGGFLSVSSNAALPGSGIVWGSIPISLSADAQVVPGSLHAFDAATLSELWNSENNSARDSFGNLAKFCPPVVVGGKVYMATFSNQVAVYGLLSAPQPPASAVAAAQGASLFLSWSAVSNASSYRVYRGSASGIESASPVATNLSSPAFTDSQVTPGVSYFYEITAVNSTGESKPSSEFSGTVLVPIPLGLTAAATSGAITLTWQSVPNVIGYNLWRGVTAGGEASQPYQFIASGTSAADTNAAVNTRYFYKVSAVSVTGRQSSLSAEASASLLLSPPAGVSAQSSHRNVRLSWSAVSNATGYNIYRGTTSGGEAATPYQKNITSLTATSNFPKRQNYYYQVTAVAVGMESPKSKEVSIIIGGWGDD